MLRFLFLFGVFAFFAMGYLQTNTPQYGMEGTMIDDFETYRSNQLPTKWKHEDKRQMVWVSGSHMNPNEKFFVTEEGGNNFLRVYTRSGSAHLSMANEPEGFDWDLRREPILAWDWRARALPRGAMENNQRVDDSGLAVYVVFKKDGFLVKRPTAIKYTYSSSLPVGTIIEEGRIRTIVVASGEQDLNRWTRVERDVVRDYERAFGKEPPVRPLSIRLWSDSDDTRGVSEGDFDNIRTKDW